jgi:hypothetical protein
VTNGEERKIEDIMNESVDLALAALFPGIQRQYRAYGSKAAYQTLKRALAVKERREQVAGIALHIYQCPYDASHWHLTSRPQTREQLGALVWQPGDADYDAEMEAALGRMRDLNRQVWALHRDMRHHADHPPAYPSKDRCERWYAEVRANLLRLEDLAGELVDVVLTIRIMALTAEAAQRMAGGMTLAIYTELETHLAEEHRDAEAVRDENAEGFRQALERLDARHLEVLASIPQQLNKMYPLPSYNWHRGTR